MPKKAVVKLKVKPKTKEKTKKVKKGGGVPSLKTSSLPPRKGKPGGYV